MARFQRARRESIGLLIGLAGPSGSGKTYSAMELATGMSGGKPFAVIDTEAGRAKHYADRFTFDHCDISAPFRPSTYLEAINDADKAGYPVIVVDSMSHEHAGDGGLLDWHEEELQRMAGDDWQKRERVKFAAWIKPKGEHKRMVSRLLQVRAHLILCFRAEQKTDIVKGKDGKFALVPKSTLSGFSDWIPIAEKNLLYELTVSILLTPDKPGYPRPVKIEEDLRQFIDGGYARAGDKRLDRTIGVHLAAWARGDSSGAGASGGERAKAATDAAASPPAPDSSQGSGCLECEAAGRENCSIHAGSEGGAVRDGAGSPPTGGGGEPPSDPLPKPIADAIERRVSSLVDSAQSGARDILAKGARAAQRGGFTQEQILKRIRDWKPGEKG